MEDLAHLLSSSELEQWKLRSPTASTWQPGQFIFYKGHLPYGALVLASGSVEFVRPSDEDVDSEPNYIIEKIVNAPAVIGVKHTIEKKTYPASCRIVDTSIIHCVEARILIQLATARNNLISEIIDKRKA